MPVRLIWKWASVAAFAGIAGLALENMMDERPFPVLLAISLIVVVFLDTVWTRAVIVSFSLAMPRRFIMPREVESAWRPGPKFYALKKSIEDAGFSRALSLRTDMPGRKDICELCTVFVSSDSKTVLNVSFAVARAEMATSLTLLSRNASGHSFVTSNQPAADGLIFPSDCSRVLKPWAGNFGKLLKIHNRRLEGETLSELPPPSLSGYWNDCQRLERENMALGILTPVSEIEEYGILTPDGKYKLWIDTLILAYLGIPPKQ